VDKAKNISLKKLLTGSLGTVLGLVILVVVFTALSNIFLTPSNIRNILIQSGTNAIIAVGMTYVIISGNIDISVGASLALSSCVGATLGNRQCGTGRGGCAADRYPAGTV
jgi:ribose transport system permease protein